MRWSWLALLLVGCGGGLSVEMSSALYVVPDQYGAAGEFTFHNDTPSAYVDDWSEWTLERWAAPGDWQPTGWSNPCAGVGGATFKPFSSNRLGLLLDASLAPGTFRLVGTLLRSGTDQWDRVVGEPFGVR